MTPEEELILRDYFRKKIAEKNTEFSKMSSRFIPEAKKFRKDLFTSFARAQHSSNAATTSNLNLMKVREHIDRYITDMSPYNYFDLDTLIAYDAYLDRVFLEAETLKNRDIREFYNITDFETARYNASKYFIENAGTVQSGYYDLSCPVRVLKNENGKLMYEPTLYGSKFDKKYKGVDCEILLYDYMEEKKTKIEESKSQKQPEKPQEEKVETFEYNAKTYVIDSSTLYMGPNFCLVHYIVAHEVNNSTSLVGYFDKDKKPYFGELYDIRGFVKIPDYNANGVKEEPIQEQADD